MQRYSFQSNSSWLDALEGASPLLERPEIKFIGDVCSLIKNTMPLDDDELCYAPRRDKNRQQKNIVHDFTLVTNHLKKSAAARAHFLRTYGGWRVYRDKTVTQLMKIADSIDKIKENCEVAKIIASGLALFGGGLCLLSENKERDKSREIGSAMMGIGNVATAGASAFGTFLLHLSIQEAKEAIEQDREHLKELWSWFQDSGDLLRSLSNIKSVESQGNLQIIAKNLQSLYKKGMDPRSTRYEMQMLLKSIDCPSWLRYGLSDAVGILVSTNMLRERHSSMFNLVEIGSECIPRLRVAMDLSRSASGVSTALGVRRNWMTDEQREDVINGMCLDAANMVLSAAELDTKSVESKKIREAVNSLTKEADTFENIYVKMKRMNNAW